MRNKKLLTILLAVLLIALPTVAADSMELIDDRAIKVVAGPDDNPSLFDRLNAFVGLELFIAPGGSVTADPGETITFDIGFYNQYQRDFDFECKVYLGNVLVGDSEYVEVPSGGFDETTISITVPDSPSVYKYEFYSYYTSLYGDYPLETGWDELGEVFVYVTVVESTATGTATGTATETATTAPTNSPPIAKITYLEQGGGKLTLYGTESTDTDGTILEFSWYIDNIYVNGQSTFTHVFEEPGNYVIRLEVTDDDGSSSSAVLFITISEPNDNSPGVVIDNIDDSKAITKEPINEGRQKGIWIENGRLMIPGFSMIFSIIALLAAIGILHKRKR